MLMEIVICLHAQVSVEYLDVTAITHIMRLWGTRATRPPRSFLRCSLEGGDSVGGGAWAGEQVGRKDREESR